MIAQPPQPPKPDEAVTDGRDFARRVLHWHRRAGRRDLPWQRDTTPYRVWVSEIMLQQTRVATVIPYYERFMDRFPSLPALATASLDEVLHHWSGLGYYARGRHLHRAAGQIMEQHSGRFPEDLESLMALPGVGRSTAGAVLSLACGQRHPILDGNVKRVLTRCFGIAGWPGTSAVQKRLWQLSDQLTPKRDAGPYNQAMMDIGAGLCTRRRPACDDCPLMSRCAAFREGDPERYPTPKPRKRLPVRSVRMLLLRGAPGRLLLERRPPTGIWGGLWSLPECSLESDPLAWSRERLGLEARPLAEWAPLRHTFSHYHLDIHPVEMQVENSAKCVMEGDRRVWYNTACPDRRGLPAPVEKMIQRLRGEQP